MLVVVTDLVGNGTKNVDPNLGRQGGDIRHEYILKSRWKRPTGVDPAHQLTKATPEGIG
jgi:hypothetical protein